MDFSIAAAGTGLVVIDISPKALGPTCGLGAVLGRYALKEPGDCDVARRRLDATKVDKSQVWDEQVSSASALFYS